MARITPEELDYIRTAAIGDMLGDSRAFDELGPSIVVQAVRGTGAVEYEADHITPENC